MECILESTLEIYSYSGLPTHLQAAPSRAYLEINYIFRRMTVLPIFSQS